MQRQLQNIWNEWRFLWHRLYRLQFKKMRLTWQQKPLLFTDERNAIETTLLKKYDFTYAKQWLSIKDYTINLYTLQLLETLTPALLQTFPTKRPLRIVDVGCQTFYYLPAFVHYFKTLHDIDTLHGIEVDAYKRYRNGFTRASYARMYMSIYEKMHAIRYYALNFLHYTHTYDVLTMILPFVIEKPLLAWGLPVRLLQPDKLIAHAYAQLNTPGVLFIVNQGDDETRVLRHILTTLNIPFENGGTFTSPLRDDVLVRHVTLVIKR